LITPERLTIAGLAKQNGYHTAAIGKWHLGWNWPIELSDQAHFTRYGSFEATKDSGRKFEPTPEDRAAWKKTFSQRIAGGPTEVGFDSYFGTDVPNWPPFCFIENDRTVGIPTEFLKPGQVNINQASFQGPALKDWKLEDILPALRDRAVSYISSQAKTKQPFLLYLPLTSPHTPLAVTAEWKNKSGLHNDYADFVMQSDAVVGSILKALEDNGIANNTLVIFTSDNGCGSYIGAKDLEQRGHYVSGGLRGYKGDVWEGGHRIPFIVRMPGTVKAGTVCHQLVLQTDIMATLADIFGKKLPAGAGEDSYSIMSLLKGGNQPIRETAINCRHDGLQSIRKGSWKLVFTQVPELYNLSTDIAETNNTAAANPAIVKEMTALRKKLVVDGRSTAGAVQANDVDVKY
jgi:arylsulfatase A-like enzyme